jgi:hypothetical protein
VAERARKVITSDHRPQHRTTTKVEDVRGQDHGEAHKRKREEVGEERSHYDLEGMTIEGSNITCQRNFDQFTES